MTKCHGSFYHDGQSGRHDAVMRIDEHGNCQVLFGGSELIEAGRFNQLDISPRLGNTPRLIHLLDGSTFETPDNESIDRVLIRLKHGRGYRLLHRAEIHLPLVLLFTLLVGAFAWGTVKFGIPALASNVAQSLPVGVSQSMGQGTLTLLDKSTLEPSELTPQRQQALQALFQRYTAQFPALNIQVVFRQGEHIGANAMALPDGHIVFTDQLIELAADDRELLAVLGHEIGHLEHRHLLRRALQSSMMTTVVLLVTGDVSSVSSIIYSLPTLLMELAYSRQFENEADDAAYRFLTDNNIDPEYFARIMQRLEDFPGKRENTEAKEKTSPTKLFPYLTTHPATAERIQRFLHKP